MIALLQRVASASVEIKGEYVAEIERGLLVLLAVEQGDTAHVAKRLVDRVMAYRVFPDGDGRMNRSVLDIDGAVLLVPQFTLAADTNKGLRPSFAAAATPALGKALFDAALDYARERCTKVASGVFGADMQVHLINDGPVTFQLRMV